MAVICDGIGGLDKGEEASSYVVRQVTNWYMQEGYKLKPQKQLKKLQQLCFQMHEEMKSFGEENGYRLGTTMTCVFMDPGRIVWAHYGDCRLYLLRKRRFKILTTEHHHTNRELKKALGVGEWYLFDRGTKRLKKGDKLLLCTDGLYRNLEDDVIKQWAKREITSQKQADRMLRQLLEIKLNKGERDNISALYFGYMAKEQRGWL